MARLNQKAQRVAGLGGRRRFHGGDHRDGPVQLRVIYHKGNRQAVKAFYSFLAYRRPRCLLAPLYDSYTTSDNGKPSTNVSPHCRENLRRVHRIGLDRRTARPQYARDGRSQRRDTGTR